MRALIGLGVLVTAYGIGGVVTEPGVLLFLAVLVVAHDLVWMPIVLVAGALLKPAIARVAALVAASLLVVGVPLVLGGRPAGNPSVLPLDYGRNLLAVLAGVAVAAALTGWYRRSRKRLERPGGDDDR
ncbi:hypothetical protein Aab01nite_62490 [Paractinoplanes abujensis]|uniref:Uncharacterized protein n=1 Tax=Paractinoplanes abujensis TaxID=882441 RepID=A0A7W7CTS3_9ACTN|nr:hypothetical protein [Actinoplanes abujensis]MBB4692841.1 hypothetical protein [Actinoplanes abujensis]GID22659.1 hypothetical protein Aab01nite_62490 [Actinoplanes abujensis]